MRRTPIDKNAPRKPLTAFMLFVKHRRAQSEHIASLSLGERNRVIGAEWNALPQEERAVFMKEAQEEREKYNQLFAEYKKTDAYKNWLASIENLDKRGTGAKSGSKTSRKPAGAAAAPEPEATPGDRISIFTREFLEYNRVREVVLRQLKKQAVQLEEETALLSKHVENLVGAETRVRTQLTTVEEKLKHEEQLMKRVHKELTTSLSEIAIPCDTTSNNASVEHITETSVESFLDRLATFSQTKTDPELVTKATQALKAAIGKKTLKSFVL